MSFDIRTDLDRELDRKRLELRRHESFFQKSLTVMMKYVTLDEKRLGFDGYERFCVDNGREPRIEEFRCYDKNGSGYLEPIEFMNFYFCIVSKNKNLFSNK